ncbi:MAG: Bax inhibitor-1/YccA family protein [Campylobacterales bacterium]|nr:Bax inhibitor-1/YccA family protein [Campylobacterales bacterium]
MGLYDRGYLNNGGQNQTFASVGFEQQTLSKSDSDIKAFLKQTYQLFAASLLAGTVGAYVGMGIAPTISSWYWGLVILEFALLFGLYAVKHKVGINLAVLFAFTFVSGLTIAPLLTSILNMPSGAAIVGNSFLMTSVAFGGLSLFAMSSSRDFSNIGKMLFIALIIVVVASLVNIFVGSSMLQLVIASVSAILFSAFILYDTQNIIKGAYETPIEGAIALYLDFFNLFVSLLQIFGILGSSDE